MKSVVEVVSKDCASCKYFNAGQCRLKGIFVLTSNSCSSWTDWD